jgi:hypothetical protein
VLRGARTLAENRAEALRVRKRALEAAITDAERRLAAERARYEGALARWREAGPEALLAPEVQQSLSARRRRAFRRAFLWSFSVPIALRLVVAVFGYM